jgi:putative ABC transport system ATP-binding protein
MFEELWLQGNTIIVVTHEPDIAAHARRVVRVRDGLIESDTLNENPVSALSKSHETALSESEA